MNEKDIIEAAILQKAKQQNLLEFDYRRPISRAESDCDFVHKDSSGTLHQLDVTTVGQSFERNQHLNKQILKAVEHIENDFENKAKTLININVSPDVDKNTEVEVAIRLRLTPEEENNAIFMLGEITPNN